MTPGMARSSVPFGPTTLMRRSSTVTVTPSGTAIGARPMRLMTTTPGGRSGRGRDSSPHEAEDLAADAGLSRFAIGQQPAAGGKYGDAEAPEHAGNLVGLCVDAQTGLAHTAEPGDGALAFGRV